MMKKPFSPVATRTISAAALVLISGVSVFSPLMANAAFGDRAAARAEAAKENVSDQFCTKLSERSSDILTKIDARIGKRDGKQDSRIQKLSEKRNSWDKQRTENRERHEGIRESRYDALLNRADTDTEKEAVAAFEKTVEAAVATRQTAVDAAVATYRKGIDASLNDHQDDVDDVLSTFQKSVTTAFNKAQSSCESGADMRSIRTTLKTDLKQARADLKSSYQNIDRVKDVRPDLKATHDQEIKSAVDAFKAQMEAARKALKDAFGEK